MVNCRLATRAKSHWLEVGDLGNIEKYKAHLVAKGCSEQYGINYKEIFSPVLRYSTIRLIIALAVEYDIFLEQMDVCI